MADTANINLPAGTECATSSCSATAEVRVHWPGQTRDMCRPCAMRAVQTACALGFDLTVDNIPGKEPLPHG